MLTPCACVCVPASMNQNNPAGGATHLHVSGQLTIQGRVSSNCVGSYHHIGGCSGGSVLVETNRLAGTGTMSAGGLAKRSSGGGGRVAVYVHAVCSWACLCVRDIGRS